MLVDMNSFFASVEQQANPFLRGKPLGVAPRLPGPDAAGQGGQASSHERSCLIGTSREAKALGIKNGTPLYLARKIYPKIIVLESEPEKYREVSRQINRIFSEYTLAVEPYSVDESFLDFRDSKRNPLVAGAQIKQRIRREIGDWLTCSVGIAPNKFMAKLAADLQKPDGLSVVWRENLAEIYKSKKLTDLWGINHGWVNRLEKLGIVQPGQLLDYPVQNLISAYGKPGFYIWQRVNGLEQDVITCSTAFDGSAVRDGERTASGVTQNATVERYAQRNPETFHDRPKSFGHSWVLNFRTTDKEKLKPAVLRLAEKAARRMRAEGFVARGIYLSVRLVDGNSFHRSKKLGFEVSTGWELYESAIKIWQVWNFPEKVMHIAVGFTDLKIKVNQLDLFNNSSQPPLTLRGGVEPSSIRTLRVNQQLPSLYKRGGRGSYSQELIKSLDSINDKYGEFTIRSGLLVHTQDFAPDAIAFGK